MKFKPRAFINPLPKEKKPTRLIDRWNPPKKDKPITLTEALIEPNDPIMPNYITRKPRG